MHFIVLKARFVISRKTVMMTVAVRKAVAAKKTVTATKDVTANKAVGAQERAVEAQEKVVMEYMGIKDVKEVIHADKNHAVINQAIVIQDTAVVIAQIVHVVHLRCIQTQVALLLPNVLMQILTSSTK